MWGGVVCGVSPWSGPRARTLLWGGLHTARKRKLNKIKKENAIWEREDVACNKEA